MGDLLAVTKKTAGNAEQRLKPKPHFVLLLQGAMVSTELFSY